MNDGFVGWWCEWVFYWKLVGLVCGCSVVVFVFSNYFLVIVLVLVVLNFVV